MAVIVVRHKRRGRVSSADTLPQLSQDNDTKTVPAWDSVFGLHRGNSTCAIRSLTGPHTPYAGPTPQTRPAGVFTRIAQRLLSRDSKSSAEC